MTLPSRAMFTEQLAHAPLSRGACGGLCPVSVNPVTTRMTSTNNTTSMPNNSSATNAEELPDQGELLWSEDDLPQANYAALGERLANVGDLFRAPGYGEGLLLVHPDGRHEVIRKGADLFPVIIDRIPVQVIKDGKAKGGCIPTAHLNAMLQSETFLAHFHVLDQITPTPRYLPDFSLTLPGYSDGGPGQRVLYAGSGFQVADSLDRINSFLGVMDFDSNADRTNTVAAALTVMLRNFWPGGKPVVVATATKSHAGKDTLISFAAGVERSTSISYQSTNWALERSFIGALKTSPDTGVVVIENARLDRGDRSIASAFIERFATDPEPLLFSTGTGQPERIRNEIVMAISTNFGTLSEDIMNRALPIHLSPVGSVSDRRSPIGNPKYDFLPRNRKRIAAELRGMVERWKDAGMPLDTEVNHPFGPWAATVGGILEVNGFDDFLLNYGSRKSMDDPVRKSLGILGAAKRDAWLPATDWAKIVVEEGLTKSVIPSADQGSDAGRIRGIGVVLSNHQDEVLTTETDNAKLELRLEKHRGRFGSPQPHVRYRFVTINETPIE